MVSVRYTVGVRNSGVSVNKGSTVHVYTVNRKPWLPLANDASRQTEVAISVRFRGDNSRPTGSCSVKPPISAYTASFPGLTCALILRLISTSAQVKPGTRVYTYPTTRKRLLGCVKPLRDCNGPCMYLRQSMLLIEKRIYTYSFCLAKNFLFACI